jgi:uncharacterized protein YkwD
MTQQVDRGAADRKAPSSASRAALLATVAVTALATASLVGCSVGTTAIESAAPADLGVQDLSAASSSADPSPTGFADAPAWPDDEPVPAVAPSGVAGSDPSPTAAQPTGSASPSLKTRSAASSRAASSRASASRASASRASASRVSAATRSAAASRSSAEVAAAPRTASAIPSPTGTGPALLYGPRTHNAAEAQVVRLVNLERAAAGCEPVTANPVLIRLARAHSLDMSGAAGFRHNGSDGRTPFQRMTAAGYDYSVAAENLAAGQPNAAAVMNAWRASPGHLANIQDCRFTEIGVGVVNRPGTPYVVYWTQEFGTSM